MKKGTLLLLKKIKYSLTIYIHTMTGVYFTKSKYKEYKKKYLLIQDCSDSSLESQYRAGKMIHLECPIQQYYDALYNTIIAKVNKKEPYTIVRVSDGEFYFLEGKLVGNGPTRHFTKAKSLSSHDVTLFKNGLVACDSVHVEMYKNYRAHFRFLYGKNIFSNIPFECIYALVATKKILQNNLRIGIIGADNKIEIIKKLLKHQEYRYYIGREDFQDYIIVPEKGTSNDPVGLLKHIQENIKDDIDIYLVGIGIAKLAVMHRFTEHSNAVFIDVGAGVSALAGLVGHERPYFDSWINFRLKDFDYAGVDVMDSDHSDPRTVWV
jgi:hypothetical protein